MDSGVRRKLVDAWKRRTRRGCIAIRDIAGDKVGGKEERIYTLERRVETPRSD